MQKRFLDYSKVEKMIVELIQRYFAEQGFRKAVIGISGGIDSAVVAALTVKALGKENVTGMLIPYAAVKTSLINDHDDAVVLCTHLDIVRVPRIINTDSIIACLGGREEAIDEMRTQPEEDRNRRIGNMVARMRMIQLWDEAAMQKALVVGTTNRSEDLLGYYTKHGDEACALEPIAALYKTEVFELAKHLGIPKQIIDRKPSAGLWEGQTDEGEMGFTYEIADRILQAMEWVEDEKNPKSATYAFQTEKDYFATLANLSGTSIGQVEKVMRRKNAMAFKRDIPMRIWFEEEEVKEDVKEA